LKKNKTIIRFDDEFKTKDGMQKFLTVEISVKEP